MPEENTFAQQNASRGLFSGIWNVLKKPTLGGAFAGGVLSWALSVSQQFAASVGNSLFLAGAQYHSPALFFLGKGILASSVFSGATLAHLCWGWIPGAVSGAYFGLALGTALVPAYVGYRVARRVWRSVMGTPQQSQEGLIETRRADRLAQQRELASQYSTLSREHNASLSYATQICNSLRETGDTNLASWRRALREFPRPIANQAITAALNTQNAAPPAPATALAA